MQRLGLIGGTGLDHFGKAVRTHDVDGMYGQPSARLAEYHIGQSQVFFLPRHGEQHETPPHAVNYRANIDAFRELEVEGIVAVNAVGGISNPHQPGTLSLPDQLIDYTWGRESTYDDQLRHIVFSNPYDEALREMLVKADSSVVSGGVYACCQGPRLETSAEVRRLGNDGCTLVGMTGMPEAALARELEIPFAGLCLVVNPAAGVSDEEIDLETMVAISKAGADAMIGLLKSVLLDRV